VAPASVEALRGGATSSSGASDEEQVHTIYTQQRMQGIEDEYLVSLQPGSKKVKVSSPSLSRSCWAGCKWERGEGDCCSVLFFALGRGLVARLAGRTRGVHQGVL